MSTPHLPFILAAYLVTVAAVGATAAAIIRRHRALKRALARFDDGRVP